MNFLIVHLFICSFVRSRQLVLSLISLYPPLLKIAPYRAEFGPKSIGEICISQKLSLSLYCVREGPRAGEIRLDDKSTSVRRTANKYTKPAEHKREVAPR